MQVNGIKRKLRQNPGEDCRNTELGMQQTGAQTGENSRENGNQQRQRSRTAGNDQHDRYCTAGGKSPVNRQVGNIQHTEGDVDAESH